VHAAAGRCAGGGAAGGGDPRRPAVAADRASAAGCGEHFDDPPERLDHLSGNAQPAVGASQADSVLGGQLTEAPAALQVLGDEPETALLRQTGIGMAMHGCVRPGLVGRTSTRSSLTPLCH